MNTIKRIGFFSALILPVLLVLGYYLGGGWMFSVHVFSFVLVPLLDYLVSKDKSNVPKEAVSRMIKIRFYRWITYGWVYVQLALLGWCFFVVAMHPLAWVEWVALLSGTALVTGGIGITVAHEMGHKTSIWQQFYAKILLLTVGYMHFLIEHNRGHHVRVATPEDPATSREGESFYAFWPRSVFGGYLSAWKLEAARLKKMGKRIISLHNQMIAFTFWPILFMGITMLVFYFLYGAWFWELPLFYASQALFAFTLLELVNYIEHYGMERRKLPNGNYEKVTPQHSWNASHVVSNFLLFQLQRHSDHHAYAYKPYQVLNHYDESPQLPAGYSAMLLVALLPPLWFRIMDTRLDKWRARRFP